MIILDTSVLIDGFAGTRRSEPAIREVLREGEPLLLPTIVLYEWLRGPRLPEELVFQEEFFPTNEAISFGPTEAAWAAKIYRTVKNPRRRELDFAIAAHALARDIELWTLNPDDFRDIPGLRLFSR